jgi:hypothetical protein
MILHGSRCIAVPDADQVSALQIAPHTNALVAIAYRGTKRRLVGDATTDEADHIGRVRIGLDGHTVQVAASRGETLLCLTATVTMR